MAVGRLKLANPQPLVELLHNPYQVAFMDDRRLRICPAGHQWRYPYDGSVSLACPTCGAASQRAFTYFLLRAGRQGGKTRICALAMIEEITIPTTAWWATAPTYPKLNDYVLPNFFKQIPQAWLDHPQTAWSESELTLTLPQRSMAQFRSLEDADRGRGPTLHGLWMDEICELSIRHWETIRPTLAANRGILIAGTTPRGNDWVHKEFYRRAEQGKPGYWATHYTTLDNPIMTADYIDDVRGTMSDLMFRQEYLADIVTFTGAIYGEAVEHCIIEGTDEEMSFYLPEWPRIDASRPSICGLDPGTDHPFAATQDVATPKGIVQVGEYEEPNKVFMLHATAIQHMRREFAKETAAIDRSQAQAQIELAQYGLYTVPAENDVIAGINRLTAWMLKSAEKHDNGLPKGMVLPRRYCPKTIERLQAYRWAEKKEGAQGLNREAVYKVDDDLCDAKRYGFMTYPVLPDRDPDLTPQGRKRELAGLPDDARMQIERERRYEAKLKQDDADQRVADTYDGLLADDDPDSLASADTGMGDFYA